MLNWIFKNLLTTENKYKKVFKIYIFDKILSDII